ncbi:glycosyltransferase family 9 protein, partial [Verrucomicrobiota bacterium]
MHAFLGSVSGENSAPLPRAGDPAESDNSAGGDSALIVGVNWLGDSIMSMPGIQAFRRANPGIRLVMLVKPKCRSLWSMHPAIDEVLDCPETVFGTMRARAVVRRRKFSAAFILPLSFRSALVPFLARIPRRVGLPGHSRDWMLTRVVNPRLAPGRMHQRYEYMEVFGMTDSVPEQPRLTAPDEVVAQVRRQLGHEGVMRIGLLPGAARGPSKRWPADFFAET